MRTLARLFVLNTGRLTGEQIRFLRSYVGWSTGTELARHLGVTLATVSRWENDREPIGPQAERALRLAVVAVEPFPIDLGLLAELRSEPQTGFACASTAPDGARRPHDGRQRGGPQLRGACCSLDRRRRSGAIGSSPC